MLRLLLYVHFSYGKLKFSLFLSAHFYSKLAVFDGKKAIRGGIPFVFREYYHHLIIYLNEHVLMLRDGFSTIWTE